MKWMHAMFIMLAILAMARFTLADVPPIPPVPKPAPDDGPHLTVIVDPAAKTSSISLPKAGDAKAAATPETGGTFARAQTIVVGSAMTLAIALGGLWLIRGRGHNSKSITAIFLLAAGTLGLATTASLADIGPGPRPHPPIPLPPLKTDVPKTVLDGAEITIEQGDNKDVVLHLTTADATKLWAGLRPAVVAK